MTGLGRFAAPEVVRRNHRFAVLVQLQFARNPVDSPGMHPDHAGEIGCVAHAGNAGVYAGKADAGIGHLICRIADLC